MRPLDDLALTPLEVAVGVPIGVDAGARPLPPPPAANPRAVLDRAVLPALQRPPCVVSFSGGRDSSAVLAVAARMAQREGLPPPVPVTLRFPAAPESDETVWQERVVRHLGLRDWVCLTFSSELDLVGPVASAVLRRHGLLWPPNTHFHQPVIEAAKGGSVLTGIGGDEILGSWRWTRIGDVVRGHMPPEPRDALRLALALSPMQLRRVVEARRRQMTLSWLRPVAMREAAKALTADAAQEPARWNLRTRWYARRRGLQMVRRSFDLLAADGGVLAVHPLVDATFLAALARAGGWWGLGDRTAIMRSLFADLLRDDVLARQTKARLDTPFWNRHAREFVASWNGDAVEPTLVEPAALREEWQQPVPHGWTSTLLQSAWLGARG